MDKIVFEQENEKLAAQRRTLVDAVQSLQQQILECQINIHRIDGAMAQNADWAKRFAEQENKDAGP